MEKKSIREIISVIFKAVTLAMGVAVLVLSCLAVWNRKPPFPCWASALHVRAQPCWRNGKGHDTAGSHTDYITIGTCIKKETWIEDNDEKE